MPLAFAALPVESPLNGFSTALVYSYISFSRTRDPQELDNVVFGILEFYMDKRAGRAPRGLPGTTVLDRELGCSVETIADTICMIEMLFGIKFDAADISHVETLDDLRGLVAGHVSTAQPA